LGLTRLADATWCYALPAEAREALCEELIPDERDVLIERQATQLIELSGMLDRLVDLQTAAVDLLQVLGTLTARGIPAFKMNVRDQVLADTLRHAVLTMQAHLHGTQVPVFITDPERITH